MALDREKWVFDPKKVPEAAKDPGLAERFRKLPTGTVEGTYVGAHDLLGLPFRVQPGVPENRLEFTNLARYMHSRRVRGDILAHLGLTKKQREDVRRQIDEKGEARVRVTVPDDVAQRVFGEPTGFVAEVLIRVDEAGRGEGEDGAEGGAGDGQGGA